MATKYVLIGNSAASLAAVDGIRKFDKQGEITIINRETGPAYSRVALPYYVAGEMTLDGLPLRVRLVEVSVLPDVSLLPAMEAAAAEVLSESRL